MTHSILSNSEPRILQIMDGSKGRLQVRWIEELDSHGLFFQASHFAPAWTALATHHNGHSCHALAERILAAWKSPDDALLFMLVAEQVQYIVDCGGMSAKPSRIMSYL